MFSRGLFLAVIVTLGLSTGMSWGRGGEAPGRAAFAADARAVVGRFDSLLAAGSPAAMEQARALTTGTARRLFPLLAGTRQTLEAVLDTARSRDTILEVEIGPTSSTGTWAAVKVRAEAVFTRPFLGMTSLVSVQAVHLHRAHRAPGAAPADGTGWKIADFEELSDDAAPLVPRAGAAPPTPEPGEDGPFPVSRLAPARGEHQRVTRLRLRVARRDGTPLPSLPVTPWQATLPPSRAPSSPVKSPAVILEVRRGDVGTMPDPLPTTPRRPPTPAARPDSLARYLESTSELDLTDKLLRTRAANLADGSPHDVETVRRVWRYVTNTFDYKLGATLFATSREALRDLEGDCSEASILTAALLRAAGIPSRVMFGYASLGQGVWIGHAWVEAWIGGADGGWVGVDAALREFPAGPHRVALVALSGREDMKAAATNLMLSTLNNLDIDIEGAWAGGREIPLVEHPAAPAEARKILQQVMEGMGR